MIRNVPIDETPGLLGQRSFLKAWRIMQKRILMTVACGAIASGVFSSATEAALVNINFVGAGSSVGADTAGVIASANFNDVTTSENTPITNRALVDSTGAASSATLSVTGTVIANSGTAIGSTSGDYKLLNGIAYASAGGQGTPFPISYAVNGLEFGAKDVYVYFLAGADFTQTFKLTTNLDATGSTVTVRDNLTFSGTFVQADGTLAGADNGKGHYYVFQNVLGSDITLTATGTGGASEYGYVSGLQINAIPEPASLGLLGLGGLALLRRKRGMR